jgi:hypothetical protein
LDKRIESMTFENQKLSEQKSTSETRGGLIYLNNNTKESNQDSNDTDTSPRQFYNQTRKKPSNKKPFPANQPQSITQSSRGLTNVTRTLYDPNAPTSKTPSVSVIQPTTTVKIASNPVPSQPLSPPPPPTNTQQQMQEFYQQ